MSRHLKNIVKDRISATIGRFCPLPANATPHAKSVSYFETVDLLNWVRGAIDHAYEGRQRRKRIVVRPSRHRKGYHELYTYHFPTRWPQACEDNRTLIKLAQRQAHDLEHDFSRTGLEYRIRFLTHYFRVFRCGLNPEPGFKPYAYFYQYTYVAILRDLYAAQAAAHAPQSAEQAQSASSEEVTFAPICERRPFQANGIRRSLRPQTITPLSTPLSTPRR